MRLYGSFGSDLLLVSTSFADTFVRLRGVVDLRMGNALEHFVCLTPPRVQQAADVTIVELLPLRWQV